MRPLRRRPWASSVRRHGPSGRGPTFRGRVGSCRRAPDARSPQRPRARLSATVGPFESPEARRALRGLPAVASALRAGSGRRATRGAGPLARSSPPRPPAGPSPAPALRAPARVPDPSTGRPARPAPRRGRALRVRATARRERGRGGWRGRRGRGRRRRSGERERGAGDPRLQPAYRRLAEAISWLGGSGRGGLGSRATGVEVRWPILRRRFCSPRFIYCSFTDETWLPT